jgi:hypothetical protein
MTGANSLVNIAPTGTGTVTISPAGALTVNPTTASTMNNVAIGGTTPLAGTFTDLRVNNTISLAGSTGTSGYVLTSNGASAPTWQANANGLAITDDTTTNATRYLTFTDATTGTITGENVASTKLQFNPSTGTLSSTSLSSSAGSNFATSSGDVGIGTASPATKLHVETSSTGDAFKVAKAGNYLIMGGSGSGTQYVKGYEGVVAFGNAYAGSTAFLTGDTEQMRIDGSGNVGIGTTSPSTYGKFTVLASSGGVTQGVVSAPSAQYSGSSLLLSSTTASTNYGSTFLSHQYISNSGDTTNYVFNISLRNATGGYVSNVYTVDYKNQIHQWYNPVTSATLATLTPSGNLGIGTDNPKAKLDIYSSGLGNQRLSTDTSEFNYVQKAAKSVSVTSWATIFTITASGNASNWMRGSVKLTAGGHTSGVGNGLLQDAVYYIDMDSNTMSAGSVTAGTSSGGGTPQFRVTVSGTTWLVEMQSSNGSNSFDGVANFEFTIPKTAGNARTFTIT